MPGQHAVFSPSGAPRWMKCTASFFVQKHGDFSSVYAREGSACHSLAEYCLKHTVTPYHAIGTIDPDFDIEFNEEHAQCIMDYIDVITLKMAEQPDSKLFIEELVEITDACWGSPDAVVVSPSNGTIDVYDLKMGRGVIVHPEDNEQLMIYALGHLKRFDPFEQPIHTINLHIYQPRAPGDPQETHILTMEELVEWELHKLLPAIQAIDTREVDYSPGEDQCRWCSYKAECPAIQEFVMKTAGIEFGKILNDQPVSLNMPTQREPEEYAALIKAITLIDIWIKGIKEGSLHAATSGTIIPGFKVVESRKFRKWDVERDDLLDMLMSAGLDEEDTYSRKYLSPAQAEKILKNEPEGLIKIDKHIFKPEGDPTLVPTTDKRPELPQSAEETFKEHVVDRAGRRMIDDQGNPIPIDERS